jgi:hypothetical protein
VFLDLYIFSEAKRPSIQVIVPGGIIELVASIFLVETCGKTSFVTITQSSGGDKM